MTCCAGGCMHASCCTLAKGRRCGAAGCQDDKAVVTWMVHTHKVSVIPGSGCGCPGHIRVAFGKPKPAAFGEAAARLKAALTELREQGFEVVRRWQDSRN